uniref:AAA+ ATPase domain-containing protein n=1 Tax=viral metagenome TaxID=1070528 RepID=A0A6C0AQV8_9ZZZZ
MEELNINTILAREDIANNIKNILKEFELNKHNILFKKGIYIYGDPGSGKTTFISNILKELNYDIIKYDAGDIRNTSVIEDITKHNMSDKNIMSLFNKKVKKLAIVMDEIDGMNNGDKGGINTLIKLIRPKKTKKQKLEDTTMNPIVCIGNYRIDKKIKELMKVCNVIELKTPTSPQITSIINVLLPNISIDMKAKIIHYVQGDLRKLNNIYNFHKNKPDFFTSEIIENIFQTKSYSDDTKKIINKLINNYYPMNEHNNVMNETDRTSVGLLWHENIIDVIDKLDKGQSIPFYIKQLENICFADYIDRITFQKQIWQFNEMSSLIKTFKNNKMYHEHFSKKQKYNPTEVRFTKVLTKYSTEFNNSIFIQNLCQKLGMDKKDLFGFFIELKNNIEDDEIINLLENYEINKLDINRIYRYIEKYIKENATGTADKEVDCEEDICHAFEE